MVPFCNRIGELLNIVQWLKNGHTSIQVEPFQCDVFTSQEIAPKLLMPKGQDVTSST
jgi:hypothetical protein